MKLTSEKLNSMSIEQIKQLYKNMMIPSIKEKIIAWELMDTGIYDDNGNLIGDSCEEKDRY